MLFEGFLKIPLIPVNRYLFKFNTNENITTVIDIVLMSLPLTLKKYLSSKLFYLGGFARIKPHFGA